MLAVSYKNHAIPVSSNILKTFAFSNISVFQVGGAFVRLRDEKRTFFFRFQRKVHHSWSIVFFHCPRFRPSWPNLKGVNPLSDLVGANLRHLLL